MQLTPSRSVTVCDPAPRPVKVRGEATKLKAPPSIDDSRPSVEMLRLSNRIVAVWLAGHTHLRSVMGWVAVVTAASSIASAVPSHTSILSFATVDVPPAGDGYVSVPPVWLRTQAIVWVPVKFALVDEPAVSEKLPDVLFLRLTVSLAYVTASVVSWLAGLKFEPTRSTCAPFRLLVLPDTVMSNLKIIAVGVGLRSVVRDQLVVSVEPWTICRAPPVIVMLPEDPDVRMASHWPGMLAAGVAMYWDRFELVEKS